MKFVKANIHYQNSSKSVTLNLPEFLFRGHWAVRAFVIVGLLLLIVQFSATFVHDAVLKHVIKSRQYLDRQMVQIEGTLDYLDGTSGVFFKDELNWEPVALSAPNRSWCVEPPRYLNAWRSFARMPRVSRTSST